MDNNIKTFLTNKLNSIAINRSTAKLMTQTKAKLVLEGTGVTMLDGSVADAKQVKKALIETTEQYTTFIDALITAVNLWQILVCDIIKLIDDKGKKIKNSLLQAIHIREDYDPDFLVLKINWELFKYLGTLNIPKLVNQLYNEVYRLDEKRERPRYAFTSNTGKMSIFDLLYVMRKDYIPNTRSNFNGEQGNFTLKTIHIRFLKALAVQNRGDKLCNFFSIPIFLRPKLFAIYDGLIIPIWDKLTNKSKEQFSDYKITYKFLLLVQQHDNGKGDIVRIDYKEAAAILLPGYRYDMVTKGISLKQKTCEVINQKAAGCIQVLKMTIKAGLIIPRSDMPMHVYAPSYNLKTLDIAMCRIDDNGNYSPLPQTDMLDGKTISHQETPLFSSQYLFVKAMEQYAKTFTPSTNSKLLKQIKQLLS